VRVTWRRLFDEVFRKSVWGVMVMGDGRVEIAYVIDRVIDIIIAEDKLGAAVEFKRELLNVLEGKKK